MFKKKIKSVNKKVIALGLAAAMMMSAPGQSVLSYAQTDQSNQEQAGQEQSVKGESGYRLYADDLTSTSGSVRGDITEVLPGYEIINVKLPDGSFAEPGEVDFTVTESGEYVFEVTYHSDSGSTESSKTVEKQDAEQEATEQSVPDDLKESTENTESEELTLTVTLPDKEPETEKAESSAEEETQSKESESENVSAKNSTADSYRTKANSVSARATGFSDYGWASSNKTWTLSDFTSLYGKGAQTHMNNNQDPVGTIINIPPKSSNDSSRGVKFTFGQAMGTNRSEAFYLQQGAAFSDITLDFSKDFALEGYMRIGDEFGAAGTTAPYNDNMQIDGGVTISFVPTQYESQAKSNVERASGAAYRLGAYGSLPRSIVCEFDTSTDNFYETNDSRRHIVMRDGILETGDYNYASSGNAWPALNGKDIYNSAIATGDGGEGIQNAAHIGISVTNENSKVATKSQTTDRVVLGSNNSGIIDYRIIYRANDGGVPRLTFQVKESDGDVDYRTVTYDLSGYFSGYSNRNLKLVFTFGAAYLNIDNFIRTSNNSYFTGACTGQIDIYAKEMYATPDLSAGKTEVRWLESSTQQVGATTANNAYYNGSSNVYNNRAFWPVAGDRIYTQFSFIPRTSLDPPVDKIANGSLTIQVKDLSITDENGNNVGGVSLGTPKIYCKSGSGGWEAYTGSAVTVKGGNEMNIRIELKLPELNDNSREEYYVSGTVEAVYTVGSSKVTHRVPLMSENNNKIPVSRNPMFIDFNGQQYYTNPRIITSSDKITQLSNVTNAGNKTGAGNTASLHYGSGYRIMSSGGDYYPMYQDRGGNGTYDIKALKVSSASMDNLSNISEQENVPVGKTYAVENDKDTRYILEYLIEDSTYSSKNYDLTQNINRGKSTGKRVVWTSDNVQVKNNWEFYALPVTMTEEDFKGFDAASDQNSFYRKILKEASAKIFKTSDYNYKNLFSADYHEVSGTSASSTKISEALASPGKEVQVPVKVGTGEGEREYTVRLTIKDSTPKVVSNVDGTDTIKNEDQSKIIFDGENYTISATFKLIKSDGTLAANMTDEEWNNVKAGIKVALYKQNGRGATGAKDKFYRWANTSEASDDGKDSNHNPKIGLPPDLNYDKTKGTFTVTYTIWNNSSAVPGANWVSKTWEDGANWKIFAYTDANEATRDYANLSESALKTVELNATDSAVPSVTTGISLFEKDKGNIPASMFKISTVELGDGGTELVDKRNTTTISIVPAASLPEEDLDTVIHEYYYKVYVNESTYDESERPYTTLSQNGTGKTFRATYLKYQESSGYTDVKKSDLLLGSVAYPSNGQNLLSSIRFGMRANRPDELTSNTAFTGMANFKFTRETLGGGANP